MNLQVKITDSLNNVEVIRVITLGIIDAQEGEMSLFYKNKLLNLYPLNVFSFLLLPAHTHLLVTVGTYLTKRKKPESL